MGKDCVDNLFNTFSGGTPLTSNVEYYNGEIPFIRSAEIALESTELFITDNGLQNSSAKLVNRGDLLIALYGANSGDVAISRIDGAINQAILCLKSLDNNVFTQHYLSYIKQWIVDRYIQGGQGNLSGEIIRSINIPIPKNKVEQQKIADCLSSLDEVIEGYEERLLALQDHKRGLMQNLFPQEGKTNPKYRFPEFENNGEWERDCVDNLFVLQDGFAFPSSVFTENSNNNKQVIRITDINNKNKSEGKVYISNQYISQNDLDGYLVNKDDLLLSLTGAAGFNYFFWDSEEAYINQRTMKITAKNDENIYLTRLLESLTHKTINEFGTGQNNNLSKEQLLNVEFYLPKPHEQQKIADCLSSLDDMITGQTERIEQLRQHKRGLMQGLFPKIEE